MESIKLKDIKSVVNFQMKYIDTSTKDVFENRLREKKIQI